MIQFVGFGLIANENKQIVPDRNEFAGFVLQPQPGRIGRLGIGWTGLVQRRESPRRIREPVGGNCVFLAISRVRRGLGILQPELLPDLLIGDRGGRWRAALPGANRFRKDGGKS